MSIRSFLISTVPRAALASICLMPLGAATFSVALNDNPAELAAALFGSSGNTISGTPTLTAQAGQTGLFTDFATGTGVGLPAGILLTTGIASGAEGSYIGGPSYDAGGAGDAALTALSGSATFDAAVLDIAFTSSSPVLTLNFLFASSEYPSAGAAFGDVFAIWINGVNVALVPGTGMPVNIDTINATTNSAYYTQDSTAATPFNYGGSTVVLTASGAVSTSAANTLRIAIADSGDGSLDSAVLIQGAGMTTAVPEPASILLLAASVGLLVGFKRKALRNVTKAL